MDMKKILQAMDSASTKPVEGSNEMSKFLRVVKEANLNQPQAEAVGNPVNVADQTYTGPVAEEIGMSRLLSIVSEAPLSKQVYLGGYTTLYLQQIVVSNQVKDGITPQQALAELKSRVGNLDPHNGEPPSPDFVKKYLTKKLEEGANPHKVALPVQMAMQHYQKPKNTEVVRKDRLIDKYFTEAEAAITQRKEERRAAINQYASVIAERVMMRESKQRVTESPDSLGTMPTNEYINGINAAAAENGMGAPEINAVKQQMVLAPNGEVDLLATMQKAAQAFQSPEWQQMLADLDALVKQAEAQPELEEHEAGWGRAGMTGVGLQPIEELSTELLGRYKKAAYADAKKADAEGDYGRGDKRFKGINKATNKQFANDLKKHGQEVAEMDGDGAGRDGSNRKSHSTYGSRDKHNMPSGPDIHLGPEHMRTSKQTQDDALEKLKKILSEPEHMAVLKRLKTKEDISEDVTRLLDLRDQIEEAIKQRLDPKCWKGKHKEGTKIKGGVRVNNCVPNKK